MEGLPETENLILELSQGWLSIWFNRPDNRNALSEGLAGDLAAVLEAVRGDRSVRGITLRGKGGIFCSGADLKAFNANSINNDRQLILASSLKAGALFALINSMPQVTVIIVEGAAMAGGLGMVCCGDVVIATPDAKFALTETMIGLSPAQISPFVIQKFGYATARRLMLTAARFEGKEAAELGLVDFLCDDDLGLCTAENRVKAQVLQCAPGAIAATKALLVALPTLGPDELQAYAANNFADCLMAEEGREGVASFAEKRRPSWSQRLDEKS